MRRYELTDEQWAVMEPLLPKATSGRRLVAPRAMVNAMFWVSRSGAPWRDLPERFGPWQTVYHHFNSWSRQGVFGRILEALQIRLRRRGPHRLGLMVCRRNDGARFTSGRRGREKGGSDEPADHALGRSRGGFGSKLHLVADGHGLPLAVHVTAGQINECTQFEEVMNRVRIGRCTRPEALAGDKGYSFTAVRDWLRGHAIQAVIPRRKDQHPDDRRHRFDRRLYRRRSAIDQCVGWLKEYRRLTTRFEKLALNFVAMIHLAVIERYLRVAFSDRT